MPPVVVGHTVSVALLDREGELHQSVQIQVEARYEAELVEHVEHSAHRFHIRNCESRVERECLDARPHKTRVESFFAENAIDVNLGNAIVNS